MQLGFIGLGSQGGPMARRIIEGGFATTLWARRPASLEPYADTAATLAQSPADLAAPEKTAGRRNKFRPREFRIVRIFAREPVSRNANLSWDSPRSLA